MDHESTVLSASSGREIGVAVDLSNESADAIRWAIHHYLRRGDNVTLVHLESTEMDANITTILSNPLMYTGIFFDIQNVNHPNINEGLCAEVKSLCLDALIIDQ